MKLTYKLAGLPLGWLFAFLVLTQGGSAVLAGGGKFESQLIWASTNKVSPDPKLKPVSPEIREKLVKLHLKWDNFFEVNKVEFTVPKGGTNLAVMSPKCTLEVKRLEADKVEVSLLDKKKERPCKQSQPLPKGDLMVFGGNAPDATAWLVVLRRTD